MIFSLVLIISFLFQCRLIYGNEIKPAGSIYQEAQQKIIRSIEFTGEFKIKRWILYNEIDSKIGSHFDSLIFIRDHQKIDGFRLFSKVEPSFNIDNDSLDIKIYLKEIWTLWPLLDISRSDDGFDYLIGINEQDLLGLYFDATIYYRRFEKENSYGTSLILPRAFGRDISIGLSISQRAERDNFQSLGVIAEYRYLKKALFLSLGKRLNDWLYSSIYGGYDRENWTLRQDQTLPPGMSTWYDFPRYLIGGSASLGRIYYNNYFYDGLSFNSGITFINEKSSGNFKKWRLGLSTRYYLIYNRFNYAAKLQYLTSSADERIHPYIISGFANVRGYADKIARGDHLLSYNIEIRMKAIETGLFYTQLVTFADGAAIWGRSQSAYDAFNDPFISFGIGLRLAIKKWFTNMGRIDLAYNTDTGELLYYLTVNQFF